MKKSTRTLIHWLKQNKIQNGIDEKNGMALRPFPLDPIPVATVRLNCAKNLKRIRKLRNNGQSYLQLLNIK